MSHAFRRIWRDASLHTWPAYRNALRHFVIDADWEQALNDLHRSKIR